MSENLCVTVNMKIIIVCMNTNTRTVFQKILTYLIITSKLYIVSHFIKQLIFHLNQV